MVVRWRGERRQRQPGVRRAKGATLHRTNFQAIWVQAITAAGLPDSFRLIERGFFLGSHARNTILSPQHEDVSLLPGRFFRPAGRCSGPW